MDSVLLQLKKTFWSTREAAGSGGQRPAARPAGLARRAPPQEALLPGRRRQRFPAARGPLRKHPPPPATANGRPTRALRPAGRSPGGAGSAPGCGSAASGRGEKSGALPTQPALRRWAAGRSTWAKGSRLRPPASVRSSRPGKRRRKAGGTPGPATTARERSQTSHVRARP